MKSFNSEQIKALNAKSLSGKLVEAVIFTRDQDNPSSKDYFIRWARPITFKGHQYIPLDMAWVDVKTSSSLELPGVQVLINNLGGVVIEYLEDPTVVIEENDAILQLLYIDKFHKVSLVDEMLYQVETVVADYSEKCTFNLGVNYSLNDIVTRQTIETQEFPGIRDDVIRVGT